MRLDLVSRLSTATEHSLGSSLAGLSLGPFNIVPYARKARASQDPTGMTLADIPHRVEGELSRPYPKVRHGPCLRDGATYPSPKF